MGGEGRTRDSKETQDAAKVEEQEHLQGYLLKACRFPQFDKVCILLLPEAASKGELKQCYTIMEHD